MPRNPNTNFIDEETWRQHDDIINSLVKEKRPLKGPGGIIEYMRVHREFQASESQYEARFRQLGARKNLKGDEWRAIDQIIQQRKKAGKSSDVWFRNVRFDSNKVRKETARYRAKVRSQACSREEALLVSPSLQPELEGTQKLLLSEDILVQTPKIPDSPPSTMAIVSTRSEQSRMVVKDTCTRWEILEGLSPLFAARISRNRRLATGHSDALLCTGPALSSSSVILKSTSSIQGLVGSKKALIAVRDLIKSTLVTLGRSHDKKRKRKTIENNKNIYDESQKWITQIAEKNTSLLHLLPPTLQSTNYNELVTYLLANDQQDALQFLLRSAPPSIISHVLNDTLDHVLNSPFAPQGILRERLMWVIVDIGDVQMFDALLAGEIDLLKVKRMFNHSLLTPLERSCVLLHAELTEYIMEQIQAGNHHQRKSIHQKYKYCREPDDGGYGDGYCSHCKHCEEMEDSKALENSDTPSKRPSDASFDSTTISGPKFTRADQAQRAMNKLILMVGVTETAAPTMSSLIRAGAEPSYDLIGKALNLKTSTLIRAIYKDEAYPERCHTCWLSLLNVQNNFHKPSEGNFILIIEEFFHPARDILQKEITKHRTKDLIRLAVFINSSKALKAMIQRLKMMDISPNAFFDRNSRSKYDTSGDVHIRDILNSIIKPKNSDLIQAVSPFFRGVDILLYMDSNHIPLLQDFFDNNVFTIPDLIEHSLSQEDCWLFDWLLTCDTAASLPILAPAVLGSEEISSRLLEFGVFLSPERMKLFFREVQVLIRSGLTEGSKLFCLWSYYGAILKSDMDTIEKNLSLQFIPTEDILFFSCQRSNADVIDTFLKHERIRHLFTSASDEFCKGLIYWLSEIIRSTQHVRILSDILSLTGLRQKTHLLSTKNQYASLLHAASFTGDTCLADELFSEKFRSFTGIVELKCSLEAAIKQGHTSLVRKLCEQGATLERHMLTDAIFAGNPEIIHFLLNNLSLLVTKVGKYVDSSDVTIAAVTAGKGVLLQKVLDHGFGVQNGSCLGEAVQRGNLASIKILVEAGADPYAYFMDGNRQSSPLRYAIENKQKEIIQILLTPRNILVTFDLLSIGIQTGDLELVKILTSLTNFMARQPSTFHPLGTAIARNDGLTNQLIQILLTAGADVNSIVSYKWSFHPSMSMTGRLPAILAAINTGNLYLVNQLLDAGAEINFQKWTDIIFSPLQYSIVMGTHHITDALLKRGADVNCPASFAYGGTALQLAAKNGFVGLAETLLNMGADVNAPPSKVNGTHTALVAAAAHGRFDMIDLLLGNGADQDQITLAVQMAEEYGFLALAHHLRNLQELFDESHSFFDEQYNLITTFPTNVEMELDHDLELFDNFDNVGF